MKIKVIKRQLTDEELDIFIEEVKKFFSPIVGYRDTWKNYEIMYVATIDNKLAGICGLEANKDWFMIHPFIVLEKYQKKGIGSQIMQTLVAENKNKNVFFGTQSVGLAKIAIRNGFKTIPHIFALPLIVKVYLIRFTIESFNADFIEALYKKRSLPRGKFKLFIYNKTEVLPTM